MELVYLLEDVDDVLPASFPGTETWATNAEGTKTGVEFDWLAKPLASLGRFIRSRKNFLTMPPHFFF